MCNGWVHLSPEWAGEGTTESRWGQGWGSCWSSLRGTSKRESWPRALPKGWPRRLSLPVPSFVFITDWGQPRAETKQGQGYLNTQAPVQIPHLQINPWPWTRHLITVGHHSFVTCELRGLPQLTHRVAQGSKTLVHNKKHRWPWSNSQAQGFEWCGNRAMNQRDSGHSTCQEKVGWGWGLKACNRLSINIGWVAEWMNEEGMNGVRKVWRQMGKQSQVSSRLGNLFLSSWPKSGMLPLFAMSIEVLTLLPYCPQHPPWKVGLDWAEALPKAPGSPLPLKPQQGSGGAAASFWVACKGVARGQD